MLLLSCRSNCIISFSKYSDYFNIVLLTRRKAKLVSFEKKRRSRNENEWVKRDTRCLFSSSFSALVTSSELFLGKTTSYRARIPRFRAGERSRFFPRGSSIFVGNTFERFETFRDPEKFQEVKLITLRLASPDTIRRWAETRLPNGKVVGLVHNANTLHHNTLKPLKGGLFCERIFGPTKDFQCACGIQKEKNFSRTTSTRLFCLKCDVEYTWSLKRRYQSGYIRLVSPVAHLWYVKETPSFIAVMLDMKRKTLDSVIYCSSTLTIDSSMTQLKNNLLNQRDLSVFVSPNSKTDLNLAGVSVLTQMQSKKSQNYFEESNNSSLLLSANNKQQEKVKSNISNNGMHILTFRNEAASFPFYQNLVWLKTNRENTFFKKKNAFESESYFSSHCVKKIKPFQTRSFSYKTKSGLLPRQLLPKQLYNFGSNLERFREREEMISRNVVVKRKDVFLSFEKKSEATLELKQFQEQPPLTLLSEKVALPSFFLANTSRNHGTIASRSSESGSQKWTNFWRIAYKSAKNQIQKEKTISTQLSNLRSPSFKVSRKEYNSRVFLTTSLFRSSFKQKLRFWTSLNGVKGGSHKEKQSDRGIVNTIPRTATLNSVKVERREKFLYLKSLSSKEFLLVFYAQKTSKLFKNLPKFFQKEKRSFSATTCGEKSAKLHLSITTFPVFLHIVMYLFQHCSNFQKSEIVGLEKSIKRRDFFSFLSRLVDSRKLNYKSWNYFERDLRWDRQGGGRKSDTVTFSQPMFCSIQFVYSFLRKQNILMSSLVLKLKDIIKYWVIFKNFICFQSILIKKNYSLKTILDTQNDFNSVSPETKQNHPSVKLWWEKARLKRKRFFSIFTKVKREQKRFEKRNLSSFQDASLFKFCLSFSGSRPLLTSLRGKNKVAVSELCPIPRSRENRIKLVRKAKRPWNCFSVRLSLTEPEFQKSSLFTSVKREKGSERKRTTSFFSSYKNCSFFEQFSFWAKDFQFSSGNKMLILEKRFLMFSYFTKLSQLRNQPIISSSISERRILNNSETTKRVGERELLYETLSSVNNSNVGLNQHKFKKSFYRRELSFFLCVKLFQQLKFSKHVLSVSQFPHNFEVNEHKMYQNQRWVSPKEKFKHAKINYFFGEIPSFGLPRFEYDLQICRLENMTEFASKTSVFNYSPDNLTLLFDKLNNSLVQILLEMKFFGIMNLSNMINNIKGFNKTWYSKMTPFSRVFHVNLSWTKIGNNSLNNVVSSTIFFERSWVGFFSKLDFRKKATLSIQQLFAKPSSKIQLGLVEKLIRFEKLNRNCLIFNKVNNNFTFLKAVKPIYIENYISLNTVLNFENERKDEVEKKNCKAIFLYDFVLSLSNFVKKSEANLELKQFQERPLLTKLREKDKVAFSEFGLGKTTSYRETIPRLRAREDKKNKEASFPNFPYLDKFIYLQSIEKGYLDLFFSLYFNNFSFVSSKLPKYNVLKRCVLLKKQLAFEIVTTERVSSISKLQKNKIQFIYSNSSDLGKIKNLNETCNSRGYLCLKNYSFSLHKYFRFITRKSWNSFCVEQNEFSSLRGAFSSYPEAKFRDFKSSQKTKKSKQFVFNSFILSRPRNWSQFRDRDKVSKPSRQRLGGFHNSAQFVSGKNRLTGDLKLVPTLSDLGIVNNAQIAKRERERRTPTRLYNNIYVLSNRYCWDLDEDLQTFLHYLNEPSSPSDVCIPTYADRLLKSNLFRDPPPVLGGGLIQKFLGEFHPNECSKILMVLEKSLKTVNLLLKSCDDFLEARTLRLKRNYILRRLKYIRSGSYKFTDDFLRFSVNKTPAEISNRKFVTIGNTLNTTFKLKNLRSFLKESRPEWMVLSLLPVLPPDLRPILQIGNQVAASDLNRLYQKVIYRNERLKRFLKDSTSTNSPQIKFAYRLLQEAVDNLIDNGKGKGTPETDNRGLPLKSLTELLKGKKGRFRQNLLGKRVDYSGRSVIVVGPRLRLHECGLPKEMAIELFLPFLIQKIFQSGKAVTILGAKLLLKTDPTQTWEFLTMVMRENPVLLNRAPTLHRFGFQAFQPRLVEGKAILLHPLVCPAFNADFDGDQMAVHVPITAEAKVEAWKLMLARNHLLSASTGEGMLLPSQDMVLGCYYLTATNPKLYQKNSFLQQYNYIFTSIEEVLQAYASQKINLHSFIWLRWNEKFQTNDNSEKLLELQINAKGQITKIFKNYVIYVDSSAAVQSIFIKTTPGRVLFYNFLFNS